MWLLLQALFFVRCKPMSYRFFAENKILKKIKKVLDKPFVLWYYVIVD
jgi:hypothetical protein